MPRKTKKRKKLNGQISLKFDKAKPKKGLHQTGQSDKFRDMQRKALGPGKRISKTTGKPYFEYRMNRSDMPNSLLGIEDKSRYFDLKSIKNLDDLKKHYFKVSKKLHPDKGGNVQDFQEMQNEYEYLMDSYLKNGNFSKEQIKDEIQLDAAFIEVVNQLAQYEGLNIELVGSWIWISGNTYPIKNVLKELKFNFAPLKKMWYINTTGVKTKRTKTMEIDDIRKKYGSKEIKPKGYKLEGVEISGLQKSKLKKSLKKLIIKMKKTR